MRRFGTASAMRAVRGGASILFVTAVTVLLAAAAPRPASAEWPVFGRAVVTALHNQGLQSMAPDGHGGAIIAWQDARQPPVEIFAQHVLATGLVDPAWPVDGRALLTDSLALRNAAGGQQFPIVVSDGSGGAIVAWQDGRASTDDLDIYAQHVLATGQVDPNWPANGRALTTIAGLQDIAAIASDGRGGAIVTWMDGRPGASVVDIYAQHVFVNGVVDFRWPVNGAPISTAASAQEYPTIVEDGNGGAIISWYDLRDAFTTGLDVYAQHVLNVGVVDPAWPVDGRALCTAPRDQADQTMASDGAGGAIVTWDDDRSGSFHPFAQHVLLSGQVDPAWPLNGLSLSNSGITEEFPRIVSDGAGGGVVTWMTRDAHINMFAQHVKANGAVDPAWPVGGTPLSITDTDQTNAAIASDGAGGAIVAWEDNADIIAQHVLASGGLDPAFPPNGRALVQLPTAQKSPAIVATATGEAIVTWTDNRSGIDFDVYAQQVLTETAAGVDGSPLPGIAFASGGANPSRGKLDLRFTLPREARVSLAIYDVHGRRVREIASGTQPAGEHSLGWDLRDEGGNAVGSGLYFARFEAEGHSFTQKLVTLR